MFILEKTNYLDNNLKKDEVVLSEVERKMVFASHNSPFQFIAYTISTLARSCLFVKGVLKN